MTELEAVNLMLRNIGQVPVTSISDSPRKDSNIALQVLREYSSELQTDGYDFNTFEKFEVTPSSTKTISFGPSVIRVRNYYPYQRLTLKGRFLWDVDNQTSLFDGPQTVNIIQEVSFEDLPRVFQRYVTIRAARVFANRVVGAGEINSYTSEDETRARIAWINSYSEDMELNVFSNSSHHRPATYSLFGTINRSLL